MIIAGIPQSLSPGNEQRDYWSSTLGPAGQQKSHGGKSPVVDEIVEKLINANSRNERLTACRALDRVLLNGYYVIPQWHISVFRVALLEQIQKCHPHRRSTAASASTIGGSNKLRLDLRKVLFMTHYIFTQAFAYIPDPVWNHGA